MADVAPHSYDPTGMDARLVRAAQSGDGDAFAHLYDRWFDRVYDVVARISRNPETAAEVAQDTFVVAYERLGSLRQPESFGGWLLRAGRNRALNRLERDRRSTTMGDDATALEVDRQATAARGSPAGASPVAAAVEDNEMEQLVWAASVALGERDVSILHLHLRHGLDGAELAEELGVSANAANQSMFRMRNRLGDAIRAWTLWHHGKPVCVDLSAELATTGVISFGRDAVRVIGRHADDCERCDAERDARVAPAALFAGIPVLAAPVGLKEELARSLSAQGVPAVPALPSGSGGDSGTGSGPADDPPASSGPVDPTAAVPVPPVDPPSAEADVAARRARRGAVVWIAAALVFFVGAVATMLAWPAGESDLVANAPTSEGATTSATTMPTETTELAEVMPPPSETTSSSTTQTTVTTAAPPTPPPPPPTPPPPPPPVIESATAVRDPFVPPECTNSFDHVVLMWNTTNATHVEITGPGAPAEPQSADSSPDGLVVCAPTPAASYTITAVGPNEQASTTTPPTDP